VRDNIVTVCGAIYGFFMTIWEALQTAFFGMINWFTNAIPTALSFVAAVWSMIWSQISGVVSFVWNGIILPIFQTIWDWAMTIFPAAFNALRSAVESVWNTITLVISAAWTFIRDTIFTPLWNFVTGALTAMWEPFRAAAQAAWDGVRDAIRGAIDAVRSLVGGFLHILGMIASHVPVVNFLAGPLESAAAWFGYAKGGIREAQVAPDGAYRVWAERGTGGEAYIPKRGANDPMGVLQTAAGWYGASVVPFQGGGLVLEELFFDPAGGKYAIGGHGDHVHAGGPPWQDIQAFLVGKGIPAIPTSTTGGRHAAGSLHYQGRAVDYGDSVNDVWRIFNALSGLAMGGEGGGGLLGILRGLLDLVPSLPDFGVTKDIPGIPRGIAEKVITAPFTMIKDAALSFIGSLISRVGDFVGGIFDGANTKEMVFRALQSGPYGWGMDQWDPLDKLIQAESGWNPNAVNKSSGAWGLFQFLGADKGPRTSDVGEQIQRGFAYIAQRYGSPAGAWNFWQGHHWYKRGGVFGFQGGGLTEQQNAFLRGFAGATPEELQRVIADPAAFSRFVAMSPYDRNRVKYWDAYLRDPYGVWFEDGSYISFADYQRKWGRSFSGARGGLLADNGTVLSPGWNVRYNATGRDEALVPSGDSADALQRAAGMLEEAAGRHDEAAQLLIQATGLRSPSRRVLERR
jgi:hypothetical protein